MDFKKISKDIQRVLGQVGEAAVEADKAATEFCESPVGIVTPPCGLYLTQRAVVSGAVKLFSDPKAQASFNQTLERLAQAYTVLRSWPVTTLPLPFFPPLPPQPLVEEGVRIFIEGYDFLEKTGEDLGDWAFREFGPPPSWVLDIADELGL